MEFQENLTNEKLKDKFDSQFDLVNYAIKLAVDMIKTGREPRVQTEEQNRAFQVLMEIQHGKDKLVEIVEIEIDEVPVEEVEKIAL